MKKIIEVEVGVFENWKMGVLKMSWKIKIMDIDIGYLYMKCQRGKFIYGVVRRRRKI